SIPSDVCILQQILVDYNAPSFAENQCPVVFSIESNLHREVYQSRTDIAPSFAAARYIKKRTTASPAGGGASLSLSGCV
ncbi:MAG: hypothetical protein K2P20_04330, partial [Oscillospiraceae bacterium]|nr:hypothetical protein [Oscillospiraceae bacterium]